MLQALRNLCCIQSGRDASRSREENNTTQDEQLANRFPDLDMQRQDPAPSRQVHDLHATDSSMRFEFHSVCDRLIPEHGEGEAYRQTVTTKYVECRRRVDATMTSAYEQSPTFRRLFNRAWEESLQHPGQHWRLDSGNPPAEVLKENPIGHAQMQRIIALQSEAPHIVGIATYTTAYGEEQLDWDRACLLEVIRALSGLPQAEADGHPRSGVVEYTNTVLKEMGCQRPPCVESGSSSPGSDAVGQVAGQRMKGVRQRCGLKLNVNGPALPVETDPDKSVGLSTPESSSMPSAVARALERTLPEEAPSAVVELQHHLQRTQRYIDEQLQPDTELLKYDSSTFVDVVRIENARKPGLNLTLCESIDEVAAYMNLDHAPFHERIIFRDLRAGLHYSFADICSRPGLPASVIFLESADLTASSNYALYKKFSTEIKPALLVDGRSMGVIDVNVQRSPADCLVFCLSFALKSYKHAELFMHWHAAQQLGIPVAPPPVTDPMQEAKVDLYGKLGMHLYPRSVLPVDFIKHTHSREVIGRRLDALEVHEEIARDMLNRKVVASEFRFSTGGSRNYLASVEYKRRDLLARTFNSMTVPDEVGAISILEETSAGAGAQTAILNQKLSGDADSP